MASLEPKNRALLEMEPVRFGALPREIPERGIYLFSEGTVKLTSLDQDEAN